MVHVFDEVLLKNEIHIEMEKRERERER